MTAFFLGQMVRKVRGERNVGMTARVSRLGTFPAGFSSAPGWSTATACDIAVHFDAHWLNSEYKLVRPEKEAFSHQAEFEPVLPSGHRASTESFQQLMDRLNTEKVERVEEVGG